MIYISHAALLKTASDHREGMDALSKIADICATSRYSKKENNNINQSIAHSFTSLLLIFISPLISVPFTPQTPSSKDAKMKNNHVHSGHQRGTSTPEMKKKANHKWSSKGRLGIWGYPHDSVMPGLLYAVENKGADG